MSLLPQDDKERQKYRPLDFLMYFPKAFLAKAKHSWESNEKHNPGEPMHWAKDKSLGDGNQVMRHLMEAMEALEIGDRDVAEYHLTATSWRADELLERFLDKTPNETPD